MKKCRGISHLKYLKASFLAKYSNLALPTLSGLGTTVLKGSKKYMARLALPMRFPRKVEPLRPLELNMRTFLCDSRGSSDFELEISAKRIVIICSLKCKTTHNSNSSNKNCNRITDNSNNNGSKIINGRRRKSKN